jgi:DNA-binding transcriptional ArsR family regulator
VGGADEAAASRRRLVRALAHPARADIVRRLTVEGPRTVSQLAWGAGRSRGAIRHHIRVLEDCGAVERVAGRDSDRRTVAYRPLAWGLIETSDWGELPLAVRREIFAGDLWRIERDTRSALAAGGFDRNDAHVSWTLAQLDQPAYAQLVALLDETLKRTLAIRGSAAERLERGVSEGEHHESEVVILHFLRDRDREAVAEPPGPAVVANARARTYKLVEELADELPRQRPDWSLIAARASELAELARRQQLRRR